MCAGELVAHQALTNVLDYLKMKNVDIAKVSSTHRLLRLTRLSNADEHVRALTAALVPLALAQY